MLIRLCLARLLFAILPMASVEAQPAEIPVATDLERNSITDPLVQGALHTDDGVIPCSCDCCTQVAAESFWHVDFDLTFLTARYTTTVFDITGRARGVGPRLQIGRESGSGFGWRTRFWGIDADSEIVDPNMGPTGAVLNISAGRFDVDFYRRFRADNGSLLFGAGISGASMELGLSDPNSTETAEDSGAGVSVFVEGRHEYYSSAKAEHAAIARGRWAYLAGDWESTLFPGIEGAGNLNIAEAAFGIELLRKFQNSSAAMQTLMEVQSWETPLNGDVNLLGTTIRFSYNW